MLICMQVLRQSKDKATQHSAPIPDILSLDDVLSYYISQGSLFRCQHCNILFFERGMYFLHSSLHGALSPWQCSICHTECLDKNEFTLHSVNQQHSAWTTRHTEAFARWSHCSRTRLCLTSHAARPETIMYRDTHHTVQYVSQYTHRGQCNSFNTKLTISKYMYLMYILIIIIITIEADR